MGDLKTVLWLRATDRSAIARSICRGRFAGNTWLVGALLVSWGGAWSIEGTFPFVQEASAQQVAAKSRSKKSAPDSAAAESANEQAEKLLQSGNAQGAINVLSSSISAGKLPPPVMARALYLRGVANRKLQKPAQAISDLTSALWVKNGLSAVDRDDAAKQRSAAYADAGLAEPTQGNVPATPTATTAKAARTASAQAPSSAPSPAASQQSPSQPQPNPTAQASNSEWAGRGGKQIEPPTPPPSETGFPAFPKTSQGSSGSGSPGGFFSSLFGGPSAPAEPAPSPKPQAETAPPPSPAASEPPPQKAPARTAKASPRDAKAAVKAREQRVEAAASARTEPPSAAGAADGAFNARVALVRTKAEADTILARLKSQYGAAVAGHSVVVDQSTFGNMGTFYQVKIEGYRSSADAQSTCDKLKGSGLDCVPVNR